MEPLTFCAAVFCGFCAGEVLYAIISGDTDNIFDISDIIRWVYNNPAIALAGAFLFVAITGTPAPTATPAATMKPAEVPEGEFVYYPTMEEIQLDILEREEERDARRGRHR